MTTTSTKGINIGGWLVIEKWITPSLFEGISATNELELAHTAVGRERIRAHHHTFITREDLEWLKRSGITLLRVPIGYWVFGQDDRYVGSIDRLDWLVEVTGELGLTVLLDLHAAPDAQNDAAHSGSGNTQSAVRSSAWLDNRKAQAETIQVLCDIALRYKQSPHVWGIELLNEPTVDMLGLKLARFYREAYRAITKIARPGTRIVFSDGYAPLRLTNCFWLMVKPDFPVILDTHIYQLFGTKDKNRTYKQHLRRLRWVTLLLKFLRLQQPVLVGEWSAMLPIKTNDGQTGAYVQAQQVAFSSSVAHCYWTYKTEADGRWNYRDLAKKELVQ